MFEEPLDMKSDDTRQAAEYQGLGARVLWRQMSIYAPGIKAIGQPYPQPAGQTKQPPFRCHLHDIVMQVPDVSLRIDRAALVSIELEHVYHGTHTNSCPGMITDHVHAAGPHGETLLGCDTVRVEDDQGASFDGLWDQEEHHPCEQWQGKQEH